MHTATVLRKGSQKVIGKGFDALACLRSQLAEKIAPKPKASMLLLEDMRSRVNLEELMAKELELGVEQDLAEFHARARQRQPGYVNVLPSSGEVIRLGEPPETNDTTLQAAPAGNDGSSPDGGSPPDGNGGGDGDGKDKEATAKEPAADATNEATPPKTTRYQLPRLPAKRKVKYERFAPLEDYSQHEAAKAIRPAARRAEARTPDVAIGNDEVRSPLKDFAVRAVTPAPSDEVSGELTGFKKRFAKMLGKA